MACPVSGDSLLDVNSVDTHESIGYTLTTIRMNGGTGLMTVRMYNDEKYRIIPTTIHSGGSIGMHRQTSGDDMNYILSGIGRAICDGVEEELRPGVLHICPKGSEHSIINTGTEDLVLFTIVVAR